MYRTITSPVRRYPLIAFFILAYALSWLGGWGLYTLNHDLPAVASFGPFLAALVVLAITSGRIGVGDLLRSMVRWRVSPVWYAAALGLPMVLAVSATTLNVMLGAQAPSSAELGGWTSLLPSFVLILLIPGLGGAWEEPGWRGYALPKLQGRYSALTASLILGFLWALWHMPLMVTGQIAYSDLALVIAASVVTTWLFNNASGSVLIVMLFHATNNTVSGSYFSPMFSGADSIRQSWLLALLWCVAAVVVIVATGPARLSRKRQKQVIPPATSRTPEAKRASQSDLGSHIRGGETKGVEDGGENLKTELGPGVGRGE
jgi:membrane protease YdiL (CAAX protease family)